MVNIKIRLIRFTAAKNGEALYSQQKQEGADCGSYHEVLIVKLRHKLKKVQKTIRPFRYDLNQIPYYYSVEVTKIQCINLTGRVPEELWMEVHDIVQEAGIKTIPKEKEMQKGKMAV